MMSKAVIFAPSLLLGAGVLLISGMREQYAVPPRQPVAALERNFYGFNGRDVVIAADERRVAGMSDYALREFGPDSSQLFSVYVGYYDRQVQGKSIHSPKNCLPGAGWETLESARVPLPGGTLGQSMNRVLLVNKGAKALVLYWYQGRGRIESSEYVVKWNLLRDAALFGRTEEALVRIVIPVSNRSDSDSVTRAAVRAADVIGGRVAQGLAGAVNRLMPASPASE